MDNPNAYSINDLPFSLESLHLGNENTFNEHGQRVGPPPISSAWSHPQLLPSDSMSQGDSQRSAMPFRPSHAPQGFNFDHPSATMDRLSAFGSSSGSSYCSSSIRAPEQGVLPDTIEDYLRHDIVSDDFPCVNYYPTQEGFSRLGSNSFSSAYHHLNTSALNTQETPYNIRDIEQRGCNFYGSNLGSFVAQRSPYVRTPISINPGWSPGYSSTLFDGSEASSSQSNQGGCLSGITGRQSFDSHHNSESNSVSGNPFLNTLTGGGCGSGFPDDEIEAMGYNSYFKEKVRHLVMRGPIRPVLAMKKQVLPYLLSLLDDGDVVILENIVNGILHPSSLYRVMKDKHGHRLFIELLDKCGHKHKLGIVSLVAQAHKLLELAQDCYGNASLKKLIVSVKGLLDLCDHVASALNIIVSDLMNHDLGISVIECCLKNLTYQHNLFIFEEAKRNCHQLARHQKGAFILKLCIEKSNRPHRVEIVEELAQEAIELAEDNYGNFVIQLILDLEDPCFTRVICSKVAKHLAELSLNKTGSYVVEKCLASSNGELLLQKLENFANQVLEEISTHPFGNYVLQTALKVEKEKGCHHTLARRINRILKNLRSYPYAINILKHAH